MNPVAGEKAERKLPWSKKDRYKKAAPKSHRGTEEEVLSTLQVGIY